VFDTPSLPASPSSPTLSVQHNPVVATSPTGVSPLQPVQFHSFSDLGNASIGNCSDIDEINPTVAMEDTDTPTTPDTLALLISDSQWDVCTEVDAINPTPLSVEENCDPDLAQVVMCTATLAPCERPEDPQGSLGVRSPHVYNDPWQTCSVRGKALSGNSSDNVANELSKLAYLVPMKRKPGSIKSRSIQLTLRSSSTR
jgi:hypothetical protein